MKPHELASLSPSDLSLLIRRALAEKNVVLAMDAFAQFESRFRRVTNTKDGSQKFLDDFLDLEGSREVRSLHLDNPFVRCAARLEYLLELAGTRARTQTEESVLRQIVATRERGFDLIRALASAPEGGLTAGQLAARLQISESNLSPLIALFHGHEIIERKKQGKHVFVRLTPQAQAMLHSSERPSTISRGETLDQPFLQGPAARRGPDRDGEDLRDTRERDFEDLRDVLGEAVLTILHDISSSPFSSERSKLGIALHSLVQGAERYQKSNPQAAAILHSAAEAIKKALFGVVSLVGKATGELLNDVRRSPDSSKQATLRIVKDRCTKEQSQLRESDPDAVTLFGVFEEEVKLWVQ